jgi:hypothetical protein
MPARAPDPADEIVTDHALVRWLERACGIDMEWMRARLRDEVSAAAKLKVRKWRRNGLVYVFGPDGKLVTVLPDEKALTAIRPPRARTEDNGD